MGMSDMTTETLKSFIIADRMTLLNAIAKDFAGVSAADAANFLKTFDQRVETYMSVPMPEVNTKKRRPKEKRFRNTSPYLAYCAAFRDKKRDANGKLKGNVLQITTEAGKAWGKLKPEEKKKWVAVAEKISAEKRKEFDAAAAKTAAPPTAEAIREMKKGELTKLVNKTGVVVPNKASLKDTREVLVAHFYPKPAAPSQDEIVKMKKTELLALVAKAGLTPPKKDTKALTAALLSHYYPPAQA